MSHGDAVHTHNGHDPFLRKHTHFANFPSFDVSATSDYIYDETGGRLSPKPPGSGRVKNPRVITAVDSRYDLPDARFLAEFRLLSKECRSEEATSCFAVSASGGEPDTIGDDLLGHQQNEDVTERPKKVANLFLYRGQAVPICLLEDKAAFKTQREESGVEDLTPWSHESRPPTTTVLSRHGFAGRASKRSYSRILQAAGSDSGSVSERGGACRDVLDVVGVQSGGEPAWAEAGDEEDKEARISHRIPGPGPASCSKEAFDVGDGAGCEEASRDSPQQRVVQVPLTASSRASDEDDQVAGKGRNPSLLQEIRDEEITQMPGDHLLSIIGLPAGWQLRVDTRRLQHEVETLGAMEELSALMRSHASLVPAETCEMQGSSMPHDGSMHSRTGGLGGTCVSRIQEATSCEADSATRKSSQGFPSATIRTHDQLSAELLCYQRLPRLTHFVGEVEQHQQQDANAHTHTDLSHGLLSRALPTTSPPSAPAHSKSKSGKSFDGFLRKSAKTEAPACAEGTPCNVHARLAQSAGSKGSRFGSLRQHGRRSMPAVGGYGPRGNSNPLPQVIGTTVTAVSDSTRAAAYGDSGAWPPAPTASPVEHVSELGAQESIGSDTQTGGEEKVGSAASSDSKLQNDVVAGILHHPASSLEISQHF